MQQEASCLQMLWAHKIVSHDSPLTEKKSEASKKKVNAWLAKPVTVFCSTLVAWHLARGQQALLVLEPVSPSRPLLHIKRIVPGGVIY